MVAPLLLVIQVLAEALGWMAVAVEAFGLATMNVKSIIDWMKADLGSASAPGNSRLASCHAQPGNAHLACLGSVPAARISVTRYYAQW